jgi:hypothetical protein
MIKTKVKRQIKTLLLYHLSFFRDMMKFKDIDQTVVSNSCKLERLQLEATRIITGLFYTTNPDYYGITHFVSLIHKK